MKFKNQTTYCSTTLRLLVREVARRAREERKRYKPTKYDPWALPRLLNLARIDGVEVLYSAKSIFAGERAGYGHTKIAGSTQCIRLRVPKSPPEWSGQLFAVAVLQALIRYPFRREDDERLETHRLRLQAAVFQRCEWARRFPIDQPPPIDRVQYLLDRIEKQQKTLRKLRAELRTITNVKTRTTKASQSHGHADKAPARGANNRGSARRSVRRTKRDAGR